MKTLQQSCKKKFLLFSGFLVVTLINYVLFQFPITRISSENVILRKEWQSLSEKNKIFGEEVIKAKKDFLFFKEDFNSKQSQINKLADSLFSSEEKAAIVDKVQKLFSFKQLSLFYINFKGLTENPLFAEFSFETKLSAPYPVIKELFYRLDYGIPGLVLDDVHFSDLNDSDKKMVVTIFATIRLLKGRS